ncbi:predicted protein [Verticillium alfalfae VaMs.102]|uniref:Predicted protein n=1 Tax=Verticillium alfalfae (strain VaMs.102 / ATCC MYA-4576 / FGSC 10136) TaxID=526221 RepID=C9S5C9_VERA1|nr:predicted protein [Verticillium alfalfae VaMs.102]EEY14201.1 predicted protein [Verticillium alfalfae VaMs.102]
MAAQVESGIATALVTRRSSSTTARQGIGRLILLEGRGQRGTCPTAHLKAGVQTHTAPKGRQKTPHQGHPPSSRSSGQRFLSRFLAFPPLMVNGAEARPAARHRGQRHNPPHNDNALMNLSPSVDTRLPPAACLLWGMAPCEPGRAVAAELQWANIRHVFLLGHKSSPYHSHIRTWSSGMC